MWRTFFLTSIVLLSCGVAKSDDGAESDDHADILARLDALEVTFALLQNQVDENTTTLADVSAIDVDVLSGRVDELESAVAAHDDALSELMEGEGFSGLIA